MAEFVQQNIEEMLPELEQMERVGLFTSAETRYLQWFTSNIAKCTCQYLFFLGVRGRDLNSEHVHISSKECSCEKISKSIWRSG